MKVLVCEDEQNVANFIRKGLSEQGLKVEVAPNGLVGFERLSQETYDMVLLDVIMPFMDGWELCRKIRTELKLDVPVIIFTALNSSAEVVKGLNTGADDYLAKPFKMEELLARINAVSRRYKKQGSDSPKLEFEGLSLDTSNGEVHYEGTPVNLTAKEYNLLEFFLRNENKLLSRERILAGVWGIDFDQGTNVVDVYINYLRNKLEKAGCPKLIHTRVGMGYILRKPQDAH